MEHSKAVVTQIYTEPLARSSPTSPFDCFNWADDETWFQLKRTDFIVAPCDALLNLLQVAGGDIHVK